jgi:hypothetical protein
MSDEIIISMMQVEQTQLNHKTLLETILLIDYPCIIYYFYSNHQMHN